MPQSYLPQKDDNLETGHRLSSRQEPWCVRYTSWREDRSVHMDNATFEAAAHIVQLALTPVFLLSGIAALLNVFAARLGRVAAGRYRSRTTEVV